MSNYDCLSQGPVKAQTRDEVEHFLRNQIQRNFSKFIKSCSNKKYKRVRLIKRIKTGGNSEVFLAKITFADNHTEIVAVKGLRVSDSSEPEIKMAYKMSAIHAGPEVYDTFRFHGSQFIIMEAADGDLESLFDNHRINTESKEYFIRCMLWFIKYFTIKHKMYCCDMRPPNFVYYKDGSVKLIDFDSKYCVKNLSMLPGPSSNRALHFLKMTFLNSLYIIYHYHDMKKKAFVRPFFEHPWFANLTQEELITYLKVFRNHNDGWYGFKIYAAASSDVLRVYNEARDLYFNQ